MSNFSEVQKEMVILAEVPFGDHTSKSRCHDVLNFMQVLYHFGEKTFVDCHASVRVRDRVKFHLELSVDKILAGKSTLHREFDRISRSWLRLNPGAAA